MKKRSVRSAEKFRLLLSAALLFCGLFVFCRPAQAALGSAAAPAGFFRYGRTQLDGAALYAYDLLAEQLIRDDPADTLYPAPGVVDREALKQAMRIFMADYPECFWLTGGYEFALNGDYCFEIYLKTRWQGGTLMMMRQAVEQQTERFLEDITGEDPWELALAIHDKLTQYLRYEASDKDQTLYGAMVERRCVCTGYARAYQYLLNRVGIPAFLVEGDADNGAVAEPERHAWTLFWPEEGVCLYADVTWDDHGDEAWHRRFALSAVQMAGDHFPDPDLIPLPACEHEGLDYYHRGRGLLLTEGTTAEEAAAFCRPAGEDRYILDLYCEGMEFESWAVSANIRPLIAALGYENAAVCAYQLSNRFSGPEYRMTLQINGGIRTKPAETTEPLTLPPAGSTDPETVPAVTAESGEAPESTALPAETAAEESTPAAETTAEKKEESTDFVLTFPAETAETNGSEEGGILPQLLELVKGAGIVFAAIIGLILGLIVLSRIGKKK